MSRGHQQPAPSSSNLYFVFTRRTDSEGRVIEGEWRGIQGWKKGFKGPLTRSEAMRIQALVGAEIVPVEIEDFDELLIRACEKAGVAPPEELIDRALGEEGGDNSSDNSGDKSDDNAEDDEDDAQQDTPDFPGYQEAMSIMSDHEFDFMEAGGGRKEENLRDAWEIFTNKVQAGDIQSGE